MRKRLHTRSLTSSNFEMLLLSSQLGCLVETKKCWSGDGIINNIDLKLLVLEIAEFRVVFNFESRQLNCFVSENKMADGATKVDPNLGALGGWLSCA